MYSRQIGNIIVVDVTVFFGCSFVCIASGGCAKSVNFFSVYHGWKGA